MGINLRVPQNSVKVDGRNSSIQLAQNAIKGDDGGYYIPSIDSEGNLTWAPSETEMPAVGGTNIKGPKGDSGVWVGTETPDGDYNVWVKPDDQAIEIATKADLDGKQDKLTAGTNITIDSNNVISAAGGGADEVWIGSEEPTGDQTVWIDPTGSETAGLVTQAELANKQDKLTAGTNITIDSNNVISATGLVTQAELASKQDKLTVGDNITIENNVISASAPPTATTSTLGLVKPDGTSITIADGVISSTQPTKTSELTNDSGFITNEYHDATKQDKLTAGTNITIDSNNVISASGSGGGESYTLPVASDNTLGGVKVIHNRVFSSDDGNKVLMDNNNQLFIPYASRGRVGLVGFNPNYFDIDAPTKLLSPKKATIANLGVVKPDGATITIDDDGVISAAGSSGSSDTRFIVINKDVSDTLTDEEGALLYKAATNLGKYSLTFINNSIHQYNNCIRIYKDNNSSRYYFVFYNTMSNDTSNNCIVRYYGSPINNKIKKLTYDWQYDTTLLDTNNWSSYISVPSDWNSTADISDSNLYNAKEIAIYWEYNSIYHCNYYNFSSNSYLGYFNGLTFCAMNDYNNGNSTWNYNGSNINTNNMNIQTIYYKT